MSEAGSTAGRVVYFVRDLVFTAKIREAAERLGVVVAPVRDPDAFPAAADGARLVIVDLRLPRAIDVLMALASASQTASIGTIGFVGHEERSVMEAARAAGCRQVLAKGEFAARLPSLLAGA